MEFSSGQLCTRRTLSPPQAPIRPALTMVLEKKGGRGSRFTGQKWTGRYTCQASAVPASTSANSISSVVNAPAANCQLAMNRLVIGTPSQLYLVLISRVSLSALPIVSREGLDVADTVGAAHLVLPFPYVRLSEGESTPISNDRNGSKAGLEQSLMVESGPSRATRSKGYVPVCAEGIEVRSSSFERYFPPDRDRLFGTASRAVHETTVPLRDHLPTSEPDGRLLHRLQPQSLRSARSDPYRRGRDGNRPCSFPRSNAGVSPLLTSSRPQVLIFDQ